MAMFKDSKVCKMQGGTSFKTLNPVHMAPQAFSLYDLTTTMPPVGAEQKDEKWFTRFCLSGPDSWSPLYQLPMAQDSQDLVKVKKNVENELEIEKKEQEAVEVGAWWPLFLQLTLPQKVVEESKEEEEFTQSPTLEVTYPEIQTVSEHSVTYPENPEQSETQVKKNISFLSKD